MASTRHDLRADRWYGCALAGALTSVGVLLLPMSTLIRATVAPAMMAVVGSVSAATLFVCARKVAGRSRLAWTLIATSTALWAATRAFTTVWTIVHRTPTPRLSGLDLVLTVAVVLAVTGVCTLPGHRSGNQVGRLLGGLDTLTVVANIALALWMTLVHAILHRGFVGDHDKVSLLIFAGFDVAMVTRALMLASRPPAGRRHATSAFAAAWVLFAGSDIHIMSGIANGNYTVGTLGDAGWLLGTTLLAVSARLWVTPSTVPGPPPMWRAVLLPYAVLPITVMSCLYGATHGASFGVIGIALTAVIVTTVFSRQLATLAQNIYLVENMAAQENELRYLATHDPLTGLANRRLFRERLDDVLRTAEAADQIAVIFIDLDEFKLINDTRGHGVGDELLRCTAERLATCVRAVDLVARMGGDEFAVLLTSGGEAAAQAAASRLAEDLRAPIIINGTAVLVRASIGIAAGGSGMDGPLDDLLVHADTAMYAAKLAGKGRTDEAARG